MKRIVAGLLVALALGAGAWTLAVVNHEEALGTTNEVLLQRGEVTGNGSDQIGMLSFVGDNLEDLDWSLLSLELMVNGNATPCGFGLNSVDAQATGLVSSSLSADGATFTMMVDATDEEAYTHVNLPHQNESTEANHTLRFSTSSVFLADGIQWVYLEGVGFGDDVNLSEIEFSNDTSEKLPWYDYDFAVHRVTPKNGLFLLNISGEIYRMDFMTYYNEADEGRFPKMRVAAEEPATFPALNDPSRVVPSSCLIQTTDVDPVVWNANETLVLVENNLDLVSPSAEYDVVVTYEGKEVRMVEA